MRRGPHALALLALLTSCRVDHERLWASALANAPFIYLAGLALLYRIHRPWERAVPGLRFGASSHGATFAALVALALWAAPEARFDGVILYWLCFGGTTLTLWLLVWRIGLIWPKSQPSRWSGAAAFGLSVSPAVAGLASRELREFGELGVAAWVFGSGLGLTFVATLAVVGWEARRVGQQADRVVAAEAPDAP